MPPFHNKEEVLNFLLNRLPAYERAGRRGYRPGLKNIRTLLRRLGNPHEKVDIIHVGGTNGKGFVVHFTGAYLLEMGYRVGIHTSPHIIDLRERFKINDGVPPWEEVIEAVNWLYPTIVETGATFFEVSVALAFHFFAYYSVDWAIVEVGLGGRHDATNIVMPSLSVITSIGWDHMDILGNTLQAIAREKGGIIKRGRPVLVGNVEEAPLKVLKTIASRKKSPFYSVHDFPEIIRMVSTLQGLPALFPQVRDNMAVSLSAISLPGLSVSAATAEKALPTMKERLFYRGRFEFIQKVPPILLDCAHNITAIQSLCASLPAVSTLRVVFALSSDRPAAEICKVFPEHALFYVTQYHGVRSLPAKELARFIPPQRIVSIHESPIEAFEEMRSHLKEGEMGLITGSFYLMAEIVKYLTGAFFPE